MFFQINIFGIIIKGQIMAPGNYEVEFDASNLASGIYLYQLRAGNFSDLKKLILLK